MASLISKLPEHEKQALALCGISQDSQMMKANIDSLLSDLHQAQSFFPEEASALSDSRLKEIYAMVCGTRALQAPPRQEEPAAKAESHQEKGEERETVLDSVKKTGPERAYPALNPRRHQHRKRPNTEPIDQMQAPGISRSVHCSRPIATYIGALSMILFYAGLTWMVLIPALLFMGFLAEESIYVYFFFAIAAMVPYAIHGSMVSCSVCNMKFFMLRHYNINRHAHKLPLLGWTTLPTALHIIFRLWYRCPACGTSLRLYRHRH